MEFHPGKSVAHGSLHIFVPGGALAAVLSREGTAGGGWTVGRLRLDPIQALTEWRLRCKDIALIFSDPGIAGVPAAGQRHGSAGPVDLDLRFEASMEPVGSAERATDVDEQKFVRVVSSGHFEQAGTVKGSVRIGPNTFDIDGACLREKSWGTGNATATHGMHRFIIPLGDDLVIGARAVRVGDRAMRSGWVLRSGARRALGGFSLEASYEGRSLADVRLRMTDAEGASYEIAGDAVASLPLKESGARTVITVMRYTSGDRTGLGFAETIEG